jgi:hypothetical protein
MNALARYEPGNLARADGNVVQFAAGGVAADVRVERVDRRRGASWYAVRLASTDADVTGRLLGVHRNGEITDLGGVAVAPGSIGSARLAVVAPRGTYRSMFLEIRSQDVLVRVDAPVPPQPPGIRPWKAGVALVAFGAIAACGGLVALALPRDPMLSAPARAIAGMQVRLPYAAGGDGLVEYSASSDDGRVLIAGNLTRRNGEIAFAVPASAASHRVSVALSVHGPLGVVSRTATFAVAPPEPAAAPTTAVARVMSFSARRDTGAAGDTILASYLAIGERGTVALLDAAGKIVASAPFAHVGTNRLAVPSAYQTQPMTARITVHRGMTVADASVAIPPSTLAQPSASPGAQASAAPDAASADAPEAVTPLDAMSSRTSGGTIAIVGRAVAGHALALHVAASSSPMQVELQDETGGTLAETTIAPRVTSAALPLPAATATTTYFVALHYARNGGEETVVRTVIAAPH